MEFDGRKVCHYIFRSLDTTYLRRLEDYITDPVHFEKKYGVVLTMLKTTVDDTLLSVLLQFYDPQYHCFTFPDYQLLPTLEEYTRLVGLPIKESIPFPASAPDPEEGKIAQTTGIGVAEVKENLVSRWGTLGFTLQFLMEKAFVAAQKHRRKYFEAIYALILYGIILFPSHDGFIDMNAIKIFLARNPVPTMLANTYHTIHTVNAQQGGIITCCLPVLYRWFCSYLPSAPTFWDRHNGSRWPQKIMSLAHTDIVWTDKLHKNCLLINSCGEFFNVPLLGTEGGISYNPALARRQFGYPIHDEPQGDQVEPLYFRLEGYEHLKLKVLEAWGYIRKLGKKSLGRPNNISMDIYLHWVRHRASEIKMPYHLEAPVFYREHASLFSDDREGQERSLARTQQNAQTWQNKFETRDYENMELRRQLAARDQECSSYRKGNSQENALTLLASVSASQHVSIAPSSSKGMNSTDEPTSEKAPMEIQLQQLYQHLYGTPP